MLSFKRLSISEWGNRAAPLCLSVEKRPYTRLGKRITHLEEGTGLEFRLRAEGLESHSSHAASSGVFEGILGQFVTRPQHTGLPGNLCSRSLEFLDKWKSKRAMEPWLT